LEIRESISDRGGIAASLCNIGGVYRRQGKVSESRSNFERALVLAGDINAKELIAHTYCDLGLLCKDEAEQIAGDERTQKTAEAIAQLEQGLAIFREMKQKDKDVQEYEKELEKLKTKS
ncbi:MAG TPA: tetratricopeptide repeat protein, partial [Candidatus Kapabacteria bacterium]|nr:tetratricopeptide repeat protein [Candidatus Kapabacteria bacterium]